MIKRQNVLLIAFIVLALFGLHYLFVTGNLPSPSKLSSLGSSIPNPFRQSVDDDEFHKGILTSPHGVMEESLFGGTSTYKNTSRVKGTFVVLVRNIDLHDLRYSMKRLEDRFNHKYNYPYVFLNDAEFTDEFKELTSSMTNGKTYYGHISKEHWSVPDFIDDDRAAQGRALMESKGVLYGGSVSYRHMCRFESGFFFRHPLLDQFDYYWRVEPNVEFYCDIDYDPFRFMQENGKKYGWTISLYEYRETIPTLWETVKSFMKEHPEHIAESNFMDWISNDGGETYNFCHFWSNFEIGDLNFWRSKAYLDFFKHLDDTGGFFYERWGDAPVHSIAAALLIKKDEIHWFRDIGYKHNPFIHCPEEKEMRLKCHCDGEENFDWNGYSCTARYIQNSGST